MTAFAATRACFSDDLLRYRRSWGLWVILLIVPVGARYLVDGSAVHIALDQHLLIMTWGTVGVTIGVVASTMLLPIAFLYLRSNVTRRRAWQVEDVAPSSRLAMVLGHFAADLSVLLAALAFATVAGWILAWHAGQGSADAVQLAVATWLIAGPSLVCLVAIRHLLNALPLTRGALGDVVAFFCWMALLAMPAAVAGRPSGFAVNMYDPGGYIRPIVGRAALQDRAFAVGGGPVLPGRVALDARAGLDAPGYVASRFAWLSIGLGLVLLAGLIDQPARLGRRRVRAHAVAAWLSAKRPVRASAVPAKRARSARSAVIAAEFRLIGRGVAFPILAVAAAALGLFHDFRHIGSPAGLLVLVFALSAQAGRSEAKGLLRLTSTMPTVPAFRRAAFIAAGTGWAMLIALPGAVMALSPAPLWLAGATGAGTAVIAAALAALARSAAAPRMVLLIAWYAYFAA